MSNVSTITTINNVAATYSAPDSKTTESKKNTSTSAAEKAAVYTASTETEKANDSVSSKMNASTDYTNVISKLQADAEARTANLRSIVEKLMLGQGKASAFAVDGEEISDESIWKFLASGDYEVSPEVKAQAQEDIAEGGYWSVEETSDRIVDFAIALSGNDSSKADELLEAFKKGYEQAEKLWGGELPEISKKTFDSVLDKFDQWKNGTYPPAETEDVESSET
ncbi:MAG: hypothetical protein K6F39_07075 [Lachnospiraceae bacterium]|nr:hypothetical protein [Lachnospiraceae bacterium]